MFYKYLYFFFVSHSGMKDRGFTCQFHNARISLHIYFIKIFTFSYEISVFNKQQGVVHNRRQLMCHGNSLMEECM